MLLVLLREGLHDLDRRHAPLHERIDPAFEIAHLGRDVDDLAVERGDQREQHRHDRQRQHGQQRVHREQHDQHAAEQHQRRQDRQQPVHDHRLHGETVGGDAVHQIADPLAAVIAERQPLQMRVEVAAQIVDHRLPDPDRRVVVPAGQRAGAEMHQHDADAGEQQQRQRRQAQQLADRAADRRRLAAEHMVDDDLQRPRLQQLERRRPERPAPAPARPASDAISDRAEIWRSLQPFQTVSSGDERLRPTSRRCRSAARAPAIGSAGISLACRATASMMRCISRPKVASCQPITPRLTSPAAKKIAATNGAPRIRLPAASAA